MAKLEFGDGFAWGVATSAYQIEGAWNQDDRGESIWSRYAHSPYHIPSGENADIAVDHYQRMTDDVALMKPLRYPWHSCASTPSAVRAPGWSRRARR